MKAWIRTLWDATLFRSEAYTGFRDRRDVFFQGFLVIVVVALLAGLPVFVGHIANIVRPSSPEAELQQARTAIERAFSQVAPFVGGMSPEARDALLAQVERNFETWFAAGLQIANLSTIAPKPLGGLFEAVGGWLSLPFTGAGFPLAIASLATWLGYGIWVMLVAKLLGGRATLARFFGTSALYAVPHILNIFAWIPCVGPIIGFVAAVWGLAIYVKATAVSHELSLGRALLAALLPILVLAVLAFVISAVLAVAIAISLAGQ